MGEALAFPLANCGFFSGTSRSRELVVVGGGAEALELDAGVIAAAESDEDALGTSAASANRNSGCVSVGCGRPLETKYLNFSLFQQ